MIQVFKPGETFKGYVVERNLGEGGMGSVYLASNQETGAKVAIKALDRMLARTKTEYVKRFMREANLASQIRHPNLVAVYDSGYDKTKDVNFIIMEYVEGESLRSAIAMGGPLPADEAAGVVLQIAGVLDAAARYGLIHRDLKPENIMVAPGGCAKLLDLGAAKVSHKVDSLRTMAASVFGTPAYIAPEQAVDSSSVDLRADIYSLGIILFELLSGERPYEGDTPVEALKFLLGPEPVRDVRDAAPGVPAPLAALVAKMCAKRKEDRFASPKELIDAFSREGYSAKNAPSAAVADTSQSGASMHTILGIAGHDGENAMAKTMFSIESEDPEVHEFLVRRKRTKNLKTAAKIAAGAAAAAAAAAAVAVRAFCAAILLALPLVAAGTPAVQISAAARDPGKDVWAAADAEYARLVMADVFAAAGLDSAEIPFRADGMFDPSRTEVLCSVFKTPELAEKYDFPLQPMARMHFGLYATPERAEEMLKIKITDWPRMKVGYSPVSQGRDDDRERYFAHATLSPDYVEYPTSAGAVDALKKGEIDILFLYTPQGKRPEGLVEVVPIGSRNAYFAVRKDRPDLFKRLVAAYRQCYIEKIDKYDSLRETMLGIPVPSNRVRVAAYTRGHLFEVNGEGNRSGVVEDWLNAIVPHAHWTLDYVYGDYGESLADVSSGRLDIVGGIGFSPERSELFLYPHTPIGMLRVYLWAKLDSRFRAGDLSSWKGMRVGILSGALSADRVKQHLESIGEMGITLVEFKDDASLKDAYFSGRVDACVDIEMPAMDKEKALHIYASHPMYICLSPKRRDLFFTLEKTLDDICDDFPRYMRMITERHYGVRNEMAALTFAEAEWLKTRLKDPAPVMVNFSPWPVPLRDENGKLSHFAGRLLEELSEKTGLAFDAEPQTGIQTAEARFLRGDTQLWIPYPEKADVQAMGGSPVFSMQVPKIYSTFIGASAATDNLELWAGRDIPDEFANILRKVVSAMDPAEIQEMFITAVTERNFERRIFGLTDKEFERLLEIAGISVLSFIAIFAVIMSMLLRRQVRRANRAAETAREYSSAKTRFLAMMSHELRTPLNAVIGFAEFLARSDCDEKCKREYIDGIQVSAHTLLDLINDVLDLSKLDSGAMHMLSGECDIAKVSMELPAIFGAMLSKAGVELVVRRSGGVTPPVLRISHSGVKQILINLVGNSAKFTDQGRIVVEYGWLKDSNTLTISVRDTGCGISPEKLDRIFDPFVQDIRSRMMHSDGSKRGTGLGLPIVKRMVDAAGGKIEVSSELGRGTRFDIEIPGLESIRPSEVREATAAGRTPERVLVVDDIAINRKILGIHLRNLGVADVRFAENGKVALEAMKEWIPEIVLTDMWMPEMDGQQLVSAVRADRRLDSVRVVAVTADVDVGSTYDMSLFEKILAKPVTGEKLQALFA